MENHALTSIKIPTFGGIEQKKSPLKIAENRSFDASNVLLNNPYGALNNEIGMTKLSNSGAGKPINALWQMKDRDVVYQRGSHWINGAWVDGDEENIFSFANTSSSFYLGSGAYEICYYNGYIWSAATPYIGNPAYPYNLLKVDINSGNASSFTLSGNYISCLGYSGIAIDEINGFIYLASTYQILKYKTDGTYVGIFDGGRGTVGKQFWTISDLLVDTSTLYVYKYDYQGNQGILGTVLDSNFNPSEYGVPIFDYTNLYLYVVDSYNGVGKVIKMTFDGSEWTSIGSVLGSVGYYEDFKFAGEPRKLVNIKDRGYFIVSEMPHRSTGIYGENNTVSFIKFKFDGSMWERINFPIGSGDFQFSTDPLNNMIYNNGVLYISDSGSGRVIKTDPDFTTWESINFRELYTNASPCGMALDCHGDLFVQDWWLNRLYKTSYFNS